MKLINGFLIAITCRGNIVIVTPSIEQHLGHCQVSFSFKSQNTHQFGQTLYRLEILLYVYFQFVPISKPL